jgi:hypothetical protein
MSPVSKRQQTQAKRNREHAVQEKRTLKREKKRAAAAARAAAKAGGDPQGRARWLTATRSARTRNRTLLEKSATAVPGRNSGYGVQAQPSRGLNSLELGGRFDFEGNAQN